MEQAVKPAALEDVDASRILDLDVREDLRSGREPFQRIMHARQALAHDGILRIRAIFEPRPLYVVMARQGLDHWTERLADDDWRIWFYPDGKAGADADEEAAFEPAPTEPPPAAARVTAGPRVARGPALPNCGSPKPEPTDIHLLDVRDLEPPEPMQKTLEALAGLERGHTLIQINSRVPQFLLPELEARGFQYQVREEQPGVVRVFIRHAEEKHVLDVRVLPPREKHPTIFATFDALDPGTSFIIHNDHDPVPLKYQFMAERGPEAFTWEYLEEGPVSWRVEIGKAG